MAPRRKQTFAQTLAMWKKGAVLDIDAVRAEAAGILAESLTRGGTFGPGTPVRTGRLLSGWTAQSRAGWTTTLGTKGPTGDKRDQPDVQRGRIPGWLRRVRTAALKADVRIFTEVPYAQYVNAGHPTKRFFISRVRDNWPAIVRLAAQRVRTGQTTGRTA